MFALIDHINRLPLAGLMLVTAVGYTIGRLQFRGISLGPAGGALLTALALGFGGLSLEHGGASSTAAITIGELGFVLFIYSVGFEAGPRFFASFRTQDGWRYVGVGVAVNVIAVVMGLLFGRLFQLDAETVAGMLSGALTSAPTYASASKYVDNAAGLAVAFALTYPFGLAGLVVIIQTLPRWLHQDLTDETSPNSGAGPTGNHPARRGGHEATRAFLVESDAVAGLPLKDLNITSSTGCVITRTLHAGKAAIPNRDTVLTVGDTLLATGTLNELRRFERLVGPEIDAEELWRNQPPPQRIQVLRAEACAKPLSALQLIQRHHCVIARIQRGSEWIDPDAELQLEINDIVEIVGSPKDAKAAARILGRFEPDDIEANIAIYTGGILLGLLLGSIHLETAMLDFKIGSATGLLISGVSLGWLRHIGPYPTHVPMAARRFVRDLGILLFIGETGITAGHQLHLGMEVAPLIPILGSGVIMTVTVLMSLLLATKAFKLGPLGAWGGVCGGMTSSAALHTLRRTADTNEVTISYAAAYAVASVIATIAGQWIVVLM